MQTLAEIEKLIKELNALRPIKLEWKDKLDKKLRLEFNYNSNHLEGNTLTYGETELLLIFDDTKGNHSMREYEEMKAHDVAYHLVEDWATDKERPLTEQNIKNLNEIILVRPFWKDAITPDGQNTRRLIEIGNYKAHPNSVRLQNGEIFYYTSPTETPIQMQEMIDWYRKNENELHPVVLAAMLHYKFVCIHPFDDGNGRVSRLLMNYVLLRNDLPPIIIKSSDKQNYLRALHLADVGDMQPFIDYMAEQAIWSLKISIKAGKGEDLEEEGDLDKEIFLLTRKIEFKSMSLENIDKTFNWFIQNIENSVQESLSKFEELFQKNEQNHTLYYNNFSRKSFNVFEYENLKTSDKEFLNALEKIESEYILFNLKGTNGSKNFKINLTLEFNKLNYHFAISINLATMFTTTLFSEEFKYGIFVTKASIEQFRKKLTNLMLEEIKTEINNQ